MSSAVHALDSFMPHWAAETFVIVGLFVLAWLVSRLAGRLAADALTRRSELAADYRDRQRQTALTLTQTSVRYLAFLVALALSVITITGGRKVETIAGASFVAVIVAFAAQRFLTDIVAGLLMVFERWFAVGDLVAIEPWGVQGVIEEVSLRSIRMRSIHGEVIRVHNSQILATRVIPGGLRVLEIELFVSDLEAGLRLVERISKVVPRGPTHFVRPPVVVETEQLDMDLVRITATAALAPGRDWLADDLLPKLAHERDHEGIIVHGPVVSAIDPTAESRFARAAQMGAAVRLPPPRPLERLRFVERRMRRRARHR
jgi:hypothetical protein